MKGYYKKYHVSKIEGETDPKADYFVLRLDTDHNARRAVAHYAGLIFWDNPAFSIGIILVVVRYEFLRFLHTIIEEIRSHLDKFSELFTGQGVNDD